MSAVDPSDFCEYESEPSAPTDHAELRGLCDHWVKEAREMRDDTALAVRIACNHQVLMVNELRPLLSPALEELDRLRENNDTLTKMWDAQCLQIAEIKKERDQLRAVRCALLSEARDGYVINELPSFAKQCEREHQTKLIADIDAALKVKP